MNEELIDKVIEQLKRDIICKDYTAIDELLREVPEANLLAFLMEGDC
jgi:hypothetical protein